MELNKITNTDKDVKIIAINSQRMAGWLMFNRFNKLGEEADKRDNTRVVYLFKDTQKLRECMQNYNKFKSFIDDDK